MPVPDTKGLLGTGGTVFLVIYLLSLIFIGLLGRIYRKENSMTDFYLGGRGLGLTVLFLTLYATQYSGNTLIGFSAKAYRNGFQFLVSVTFMMSVIGGYLIYAPKLKRLADRYKFITPGDYLEHRFGSRSLTVLATVLCIVALGNYMLSNLKAIGHIMEVATAGRIDFVTGIICMCLIMVIYETLGGMRSVAWTDTIQGILLLVGCICIFMAIEIHYGGLTGAAPKLLETRPELWQPPTPAQKRAWLSTLIIIFFGISIYPHAIQRIYAAKSEKTLILSFQIMVFMPIVTTFFMIVVGIVGAAQFGGLDKAGSEKITMMLLNDMAAHIPGIQILIIVFVSAAVAAIMSTVDSALLAISSMFTQDIYRKFKPNAPQSHLTMFGKIFSWILMALMAYLAIELPQTIWRLIVVKLELLCQVAPAIYLRLHVKSINSKAVLSGIIVGTVVALAIMFSDVFGLPIEKKPWGFHAGVWGLLANLITIAVTTAFQKKAAD